MNFLPVPPNTDSAAAALAMRGDEPEILLNVAHTLLACAEALLRPIPCVVAGHGFRRVQNSSMLAILGNSLFVANPLGLTLCGASWCASTETAHFVGAAGRGWL